MVNKTPKLYKCDICGRNLEMIGQDHRCRTDQMREAYNQAVDDCRRAVRDYCDYDDDLRRFVYLETLDKVFSSIKKSESNSLKLARWMRRTMEYNNIHMMADEVAVQMPSPAEFDNMPDVSDEAKALRRVLVTRLSESPSLNVARCHLLGIARALED